MESTTPKTTYKSSWNQPGMVKRDFFLIPTYVIAQIISPLIIFINVLFVEGVVFRSERDHASIIDIQILSMTFSAVMVMLVFYLMHIRDHIFDVAKMHIQALKKVWLLILMTFIVVEIVNYGYHWLVQYFPTHLQYTITKNNQIIGDLFETKWLHPLLFINVVILMPVTKVLIFCHVLIHELGKKITYQWAALLAIIVFIGAHVITAESVLEVGPYLILSIGLVFAYLKSGQNLAVPIVLYMLNNLVFYILSL